MQFFNGPPQLVADLVQLIHVSLLAMLQSGPPNQARLADACPAQIQSRFSPGPYVGFCDQKSPYDSAMFFACIANRPKEGAKGKSYRHEGISRTPSRGFHEREVRVRRENHSMTDLDAPRRNTSLRRRNFLPSQRQESPPPQVCDRCIWPACQNWRRNVGSTFALELDACIFDKHAMTCDRANVRTRRTFEMQHRSRCCRKSSIDKRHCFLQTRTTD